MSPTMDKAIHSMTIEWLRNSLIDLYSFDDDMFKDDIEDRYLTKQELIDMLTNKQIEEILEYVGL